MVLGNSYSHPRDQKWWQQPVKQTNKGTEVKTLTSALIAALWLSRSRMNDIIFWFQTHIINHSSQCSHPIWQMKKLRPWGKIRAGIQTWVYQIQEITPWTTLLLESICLTRSWVGSGEESSHPASLVCKQSSSGLSFGPHGGLQGIWPQSLWSFSWRSCNCNFCNLLSPFMSQTRQKNSERVISLNPYSNSRI